MVRRRLPQLDRTVIATLIVGALALAGWRWLQDHPQHNPWAPLAIDSPPGWATPHKLVLLRDDAPQCRTVLQRADIAFSVLPALGGGACRRPDRTVIAPDHSRGLSLAPARAETTCAVGVGLAIWLKHSVQPAAERHLGSRVVRMEHLGTANCRRIGSGKSGQWSEHATGNAIDIAAFVLANGRRVVVQRDWSGDTSEARFLKSARDGACAIFATTLSPDYNAAHADHFHLDQAGSRRGWTFCR